MTETCPRQNPSDVHDRKSQDPKYLPGQCLLFPDGPEGEKSPDTDRNRTAAEAGGELFYTGKDLPGAAETDQVILWDLD